MTLACVALAFAVAVSASPLSAPRPLSLDEALALAHAQNPDLRALRERARALAARERATRSQTLPHLGVEINARTTDNPAAVFADKLNAARFGAEDFDLARFTAPGALSHLGTALVVEAPVDLSGRIGLSTRAQEATRKAFEEGIRESEAALALQVTDTYLSALLARRAAAATDKAIAAARAREAATEARLEEGLALRSDVLRVRARRREREADLASQHAALEVAEATLSRLIGAPQGSRYELMEAGAAGPSLGTLETWRRRADATRPVLRSAAAEREAAGLGVQVETSASRPELTLQARLMDDRTARGGARSWALGASLHWNVLDPARGSRVAAARARELAAQEEERAAQDGVRLEVEAAYIRLGAARDRLTAASGGTEEGREALRVVQERRAQGLADLTDELETEAAAYAAELEEIRAARDAALAEAALRRAAGINPWSQNQ